MRSWFPHRSSPLVQRVGRKLRVETLETRDVFAAGDLDASFGTGGVVRIENDPSAVEAFRVGGNLFVANGTASVAKLSSQGSLVGNYGNAGQAAAFHELIAVQSTGAFITAATEFGEQSLDAVFRRVTPAGDPDTDFGVTNGANTIDFLPRLTNPGTTPTVYDYVSDLEVDAGDKIWALIHGDLSNSTDFLSDHFAGIARLTSAGQMDATFGAAGLAVIQAPTTDAFLATDLQLTSDGGAVIAGVYRANDLATAVLYKIDASGALVSSFGTSGRALLTQLGDIAKFAKVVLTVDPATGGFYVAAYQTPADPLDGTYSLKLAKVTSTGAAATFGTGGVVDVGNIETDSTLTSDGLTIAAQSDGKPLVVFGGPDWKIARFTTTGAADADFGVNGLVQTSLGNGAGAYANPQSVLVQSDGMILVSGKYSPGGLGPIQSVIARYFSIDSAGAPSSSVAPLGAVTYQNNLTVSWSGIAAPGSTIAGYDIYYQIAGESPVLWQNNTQATSAVFNISAARLKSVGFYSIARDNLGRVEVAPGASDVATSYIGAPWQNPVDRFDVVTGGTDTGQIDPSDILYVIIEYNTHEISVAGSSEVILPPTKTYTFGRYVDVDGDNLITPSDILFVIVRYNELTGGEGESARATADSAVPGPVMVPPPSTPPAVPAAAPADDTAAWAAGAGADDDLLAQLAAAWFPADDEDA